jgi:hypothetical protein
MKGVLLVWLALCLSSCGQPARSVDWFSKHLPDAAMVADKCRTHAQVGAECENATRALRENERKRLELFRRSF